MNLYEMMLEVHRRYSPELMQDTIDRLNADPVALARMKSIQIQPGTEEDRIQAFVATAKMLESNPAAFAALKLANRLDAIKERRSN